MTRSRVVRRNEFGEPIELANGRARDDGRCRDEEHAYPDIWNDTTPVLTTIESGYAFSETCVSCRTCKTIVFNHDGEIIVRRYHYPISES